MRIGLQQTLYTWPGGAAQIGARLAAIASAAEATGFSDFWLMDHFLQIPPMGAATEHPMLEVYTALGFVAACTTRVRIGPLVAGAVYRNPAVLIKAATTLDVLARGRTYFAVGAAWFEGEARALGMPFPAKAERFHILEDTVRLARHMWSEANGGPFDGRTVHATGPITNPQPVAQPRPPIMIAGRGPRKTIPLVARYADAWNLIAQPREMPRFREALGKACADVGRPMSEIELTVLDPFDWRREQDPSYEWSVPWETARMREWREEGVEHVIVNLPNAHEADVIARYGDVIAAVS